MKWDEFERQLFTPAELEQLRADLREIARRRRAGEAEAATLPLG